MAAKRERSNEDYHAMVVRLLRSYGARVGQADEVDLKLMLELEGELQAAIALAVKGQREHFGRSWAYIAQATGTGRAAAYKRWHDVTTDTEESE